MTRSGTLPTEMMTMKYVITMPCIEGLKYIQGKKKQPKSKSG